MAKRKKTKAKKAKPKRERRPIDWSRVIRRTTTAVIALLFIGSGVAWALGAQPLRDYISRLERDESARLRFDINWPTTLVEATDESGGAARTVTYIGEERAARIERDLHSIIKADTFEHRSLETALVYLRDKGWLKEEGATVRRRPGEVIEIRGEWRQPRWVVRHSGVDYVVGEDFGLLPLREVAGSLLFARAGLRYIEGVFAPAPRNPEGELAHGWIWPGTELRAGAALLDLLSPHRDIWPQVVGVRVEPGQGTAVHQLTIVTNQGSRIRWGRPPGDEGSIELPALKKIAVLQIAYDRTGRIDIGEAYIDISKGDYEIDRSVGPGRE